MQGIILAAGMGKRLKELTNNNTKCMVKVNGTTLIERALSQLDKFNLSRIVIVIGYEGKKLVEYVKSLEIKTKVLFVENPIFDKTNNIYSLYMAKEYMEEDDTILLESDLIFEENVLKCLIEDERDTLALVDKYESWMDGTCMKIGEDDTIEEFVSGTQFQFDEAGNYYKTVNIYKFSREFSKTHYIPFLEAYINAIGNNEYYEQVLRVITMLDDPMIKAKRLNGQLWYEIDDIQDLDIASSLFATDDEKLSGIQSRYGGYWRYPKLLDFCYLVNPYYPPKKLVDEMKASFETLITQYPSGMRVNSLLAAKIFGVNEKHIVIGNGAAELIKSLIESLNGKLGVIRPSFEEYSHRHNENDIVSFVPKTSDYSYGTDDLIDFFSNNRVENIVLINPDNPSGNYINKTDILRFSEWCENERIRLILDESFVDFADEQDATLVSEQYLNQYPRMIVVKSISKSYGIPGLRLGVLATADQDLVDYIKKDVAIWNINSLGEFYMQIAEKYKKHYITSLDKLRIARKKLYDDLSEIDSLEVIKSQANYFMVKVTGISSRQLTRKLLVENNILIKDLSSKMPKNDNNYVRIAVRRVEENDMLIRAIKEVVKGEG